MKLRHNEYCPIHRSLFCCGRQQARKERRFQLGIQRIDDPHHPRGYRERRSPAEMRKVTEPKGMGGAWRDDHPENVQAVHRLCNLEKGSTNWEAADRLCAPWLKAAAISAR